MLLEVDGLPPAVYDRAQAYVDGVNAWIRRVRADRSLLPPEFSVLNVELPNPFPRMTYEEAMRRYASDKPDLRIDLELVDVADLVRALLR